MIVLTTSPEDTLAVMDTLTEISGSAIFHSSPSAPEGVLDELVHYVSGITIQAMDVPGNSRIKL